MAKDYLGNELKEGDTVAVAMIKGNSAVLRIRKVFLVKDDNVVQLYNPDTGRKISGGSYAGKMLKIEG